MDKLDLILLLAGSLAAVAVAAGCAVVFVVWLAGGSQGRAGEGCPPSGKS